MDGAARVLIVDDHAPFRRAAARLVAGAGRAVMIDEAASGEEAVAMAGRHTPDLVLMDVHLPGMTGAEATRQLLTARPWLRVLLLSSYEADDLPPEVLDCGAFGYLHKAALDGDTIRRALDAEPGAPPGGVA
jgi:DNA-binding NarL/FixJ family response regulator